MQFKHVDSVVIGANAGREVMDSTIHKITNEHLTA